MGHAERTYLPAAGHDWALPLYDPLVKLLGGEPTRRRLVDQAALRPGQRVVEIGCGTGSLVVLIKRLHPGVEVIGLDPDSKALARARRKAERASVAIQFDQGFADEMPYPDASVDRVFSSFMFHHLDAHARVATLREVRRVLEPRGVLHLLDFASGGSGTHGPLAHLFRSHSRLPDNSEDRILALMRQAGLADPKKVSEGALLFGHLRIDYYQAATTASPGL